MITTYRDWQTGDVINIAASIDEFCGINDQFIFVKDINVTKSPDDCSVSYGEERGCGLHLDNVTLVFKLVKCSGSVEGKSCNPQIVYKTIQTIESIKTNTDGVACIAYQVTDQDRLDYESQIGDDVYKVMVCITNSDGQNTPPTGLSQVTSPITISSSHLECVSNVCTRVTGAGTNTCINEGSITECATHYIEYDISSLPTEILNYIGPNIVYISNNIMNHLPSVDNIKYISSEYNNGKFRIYVTYTPSLALTIEQQAMLWSFTLLFVLIMFYTKAVTPWGIAAALIVSAFGSIIIGCVIHDIKDNLPSTLQLPEQSAPNKIVDIREFSENERAKCITKYPCTTTKTCTVSETNGYLLCIGLVDILQQTHDDTVSNTIDQSKLENLLKRFNDLSDKLNDGSLTPEEVINETNIITDETVDNSKEKENLTTCDPGFIYNPSTQKCVAIEDCWIPLPFGGCLLSAKIGKTLTYIGGGLLIGYIGYKIFVKK